MTALEFQPAAATSASMNRRMQSCVHPTLSRADCAAAVHPQARHCRPAHRGETDQSRLLVVPAKVSFQFWILGLNKVVSAPVSGSMAATKSRLNMLHPTQERLKLLSEVSPLRVKGIMWSMTISIVIDSCVWQYSHCPRARSFTCCRRRAGIHATRYAPGLSSLAISCPRLFNCSKASERSST